MQNMKKWLILGFIFILSFIFVVCEAPDQPTYGPDNPDPNPTGVPPATITTINPTEGYLQEEVTITGNGFYTTPEYNFVAFGTKNGTIVSATETELKVITPNIAGETVNVKVAVKGSEFWSNAVEFTFKEAVNVIADDINWPMGVEADDEGNVYVGSATDSVIYKIDPDGNRMVFAEVAPHGAMGWGPDNYLYVADTEGGKVVRISPDGSTVEDYAEVGAAVDFDWAENGNMYIIQNWGEGVSMFDGSNVTHVLDYDGEMKSCRIYGGYLYISIIWNGIISRFPITADGLGDEEIVYEGDSPVGVEFDVNGKLYYTEAWETTLFTIDQEGNEESLFEEELMTPMRYLTFHNKLMYIVYPGWGEVGEVMSVYIGVEQAPNHGL